MYGAYGVARRAARARAAPAAAGSCAPRCSPSVVGVHAYQGTRWTVAGEVPHAMGNHHPSIAPYGLFHTGRRARPGRLRHRGPVASVCRGARHRPDDPRFATNRDAGRHRDELVAAIEAALRRRPAPSTGSRGWPPLGIPAGKVRTLDDVYAWDQTLSQGLLIDVDHPALGHVQLPGPPLRFDDNRHAGTRATHLPPPLLGEHDASVRAWLDSLDPER